MAKNCNYTYWQTETDASLKMVKVLIHYVAYDIGSMPAAIVDVHVFVNETGSIVSYIYECYSETLVQFIQMHGFGES